MKIIPFPGGDSTSPDEAWLAELEAALNGDGEGASADSWRELRADVRALAPPMDPEFERELQTAGRPMARATPIGLVAPPQADGTRRRHGDGGRGRRGSRHRCPAPGRQIRAGRSCAQHRAERLAWCAHQWLDRCSYG
jgi:hypothetical protein